MWFTGQKLVVCRSVSSGRQDVTGGQMVWTTGRKSRIDGLKFSVLRSVSVVCLLSTSVRINWTDGQKQVVSR